MGLTVTQPELLEPVWYEVQRHAKPLHLRVGSCDTEVRTATVHCTHQGVRVHAVASPGVIGLRMTGTCHCGTVFLDALVQAHEFLRKELPLANLPGAVRHHVRMRLPDLYRLDRVRQGAQARPKSVRRNQYGRALPDEFHRTLFVFVVDEAGKSAPLDGDEQLHSVLAQRCAEALGGTPGNYLPRIPAALAKVEQTCRTGRLINVGTRAEPEMVTWWEAYVERPLGRRPPPPVRFRTGDAAVEIPDPTATAAFDRVVAERSGSRPAGGLAAAVEAALVGALVATVRRASSGYEEFVVRRAIADLAGHGLLAGDVATALLADERRVDAVLASLRDLTKPTNSPVLDRPTARTTEELPQ